MRREMLRKSKLFREIVRADLHGRFADLVRGRAYRMPLPLDDEHIEICKPPTQLNRKRQAGEPTTHDDYVRYMLGITHRSARSRVRFAAAGSCASKDSVRRCG